MGEVVEESAKKTKAVFDRVRPSLVNGTKEILKRKARPSTSSSSAKDWVEIGSDLVGNWAQNLRDEYIVSAPSTYEGDSKLIGAYEAFANELYKQADLDETAEAAWSFYRRQLGPILEGGRERYNPPPVRGRKPPEHEEIRARSRVAEIVAPNNVKRLAIVNELYEVGGMGTGKDTPTGQYTFEEWVDPNLLPGLARQRKVRAIKRQINGTDLLNSDDRDLLSWIMGNLVFPK